MAYFALHIPAGCCIVHGVRHTMLRWRAMDVGCVWMKCSSWLCLLLFLAVGSAKALDIQDIRWGFDGLVVPGRFNLCSVLVANPSPAPFDGMMKFYKYRGVADRVGAVYAESCYLSPLTTRWLQFYVYIDNQYDAWRLEWGRGSQDQHDLDAPKWGTLAQVLVTEPDAVLRSTSSFKEFPEELFPPTVAATAGLDCVLLDHAPHWEQAKRQAFLDWLKVGGKVHLLKGADGRYPVFADDLAVLNTPADRAQIGAGVIWRHAATAREIRLNDIQAVDVAQRTYKDNESWAPSQISDSFFRTLSRLSQRQYHWGWIYLMAIVYMLLVGPAQLSFGRKLANYQMRILLLLGTIAGFALLFNFVGRRGQGEANLVHSLSYARLIEGDSYDVMQWVNVFAAHGDHYTIAHKAPHNLYSTGQDYETVNGWIQGGKDGRFVVDVPMFSRRAFMHEAEMKGANIPVKVVTWSGADELKQLVLNVGPDFTKQILDGWVVRGDKVYSMKSTPAGLEFGTTNTLSLNKFLDNSNLQPFGGNYNYYNPRDGTIDVTGQFRSLARPLIGWSLGVGGATDGRPVSASAGDGRAQLYLLARSPESFGVTAPGLGREVGYVLYHFDLFKPGT